MDPATRRPAAGEPVRTVTARDLERMPEDGLRRELVRGEVREMAPSNAWHGWIANRLQLALSKFVEETGLGEVFDGDTGFLIERDPDTVRAPDGAFVRAGRLPDPLPETFLPFAPDLAIEVLSPGDRPGEVLEKVDAWLAAGCAAVWVVDRRSRTVTVHRHGAAPLQVGEGDALEGGDVLPGFRLPLDDLFR